MANIKYKISVVTVTYGNRWRFLSQVLQELLKSELVQRIIVVNNASNYSIKNNISALGDERIFLIDHIENTGSADGYKSGIAYVHQQTDTDFIWLLDDDNLPAPDTLKLLVDTWGQLNLNPSKEALYCLRTDRQIHIKVAKGENPSKYYLVPDNFLGFNFLRIAHNQLAKIYRLFKKNDKIKHHVKIPYVPYGGLFLHTQLIDGVGYPDERFFLYNDDSEYTYRITQRGGTIWLVPACTIEDIDKSQAINYHKKMFSSILLDQWNFRTYYHVRNRLFFYNQVAIKHPGIFKINKIILLSWLKLLSIIHAQQNQYKKLLVAVNDGLNGSLGKADPDKF